MFNEKKVQSNFVSNRLEGSDSQDIRFVKFTDLPLTDEIENKYTWLIVYACVSN